MTVPLPTFTTSKDSLPFNTLFNQANSKLSKPLTRELFGNMVEEGSVLVDGSTLTLSELEFSPLIPALGYLALACTLYNTLDDIHLEQYFHLGLSTPYNVHSKSVLTKLTIENTLYSASNTVDLTSEELKILFDSYYNHYLGLLYKHDMSEVKTGDFNLKRTYIFNYEYRLDHEKPAFPVIYGGEYYTSNYVRVVSFNIFKETETFYNGNVLELSFTHPTAEASIFHLSIPYLEDEDKQETYNFVKGLLDNNDLSAINKLVSDRIGLNIFNINPTYEPTNTGLNKLNKEVEDYVSTLEQSYHNKYFDEGSNRVSIPTLSLDSIVLSHNSRPLMFSDDYQTLVYQDNLTPYTGSLTNLTLSTIQPPALDANSWHKLGVLYSWDWANGGSPTEDSKVIDNLKRLVLDSTQVKAIQDSLKDKNGRLYTPVDLLEDETGIPDSKLFDFFFSKSPSGKSNRVYDTKTAKGHTIDRHMLKSDQYLKDRLEQIGHKTNVSRIRPWFLVSNLFSYTAETDINDVGQAITETCIIVNTYLQGKSKLDTPHTGKFNSIYTVSNVLTTQEEFVTSQTYFIFFKFKSSSDRNYYLSTLYPTLDATQPKSKYLNLGSVKVEPDMDILGETSADIDFGRVYPDVKELFREEDQWIADESNWNQGADCNYGNSVAVPKLELANDAFYKALYYLRVLLPDRQSIDLKPHLIRLISMLLSGLSPEGVDHNSPFLLDLVLDSNGFEDYLEPLKDLPNYPWSGTDTVVFNPYTGLFEYLRYVKLENQVLTISTPTGKHSFNHSLWKGDYSRLVLKDFFKETLTSGVLKQSVSIHELNKALLDLHKEYLDVTMEYFWAKNGDRNDKEYEVELSMFPFEKNGNYFIEYETRTTIRSYQYLLDLPWYDIANPEVILKFRRGEL